MVDRLALPQTLACTCGKTWETVQKEGDELDYFPTERRSGWCFILEI
jgi:hypothetical protein